MMIQRSFFKDVGETFVFCNVFFEYDIEMLLFYFNSNIDYSQFITLMNFSTCTISFAAFIDNEVQNVCETIDDYQISIDRDLPQDLWDTFKKEGFMGMIIPKTYGGKGFSAHGHSQVVQKISSCSSNVSGTIAVPNSLGPGKSLSSFIEIKLSIILFQHSD